MPETTAAALVSFAVMLVAMRLHRLRALHVSVMVLTVLFDLLMPVYLYLNRDWYGRFIEQEDIFSFLVWMHLGLVITLFFLYFLQFQSGRRLLRGEKEARADHRNNARAVLAARALVILTGALLYVPE